MTIVIIVITHHHRRHHQSSSSSSPIIIINSAHCCSIVGKIFQHPSNSFCYYILCSSLVFPAVIKGLYNSLSPWVLFLPWCPTCSASEVNSWQQKKKLGWCSCIEMNCMLAAWYAEFFPATCWVLSRKHGGLTCSLRSFLAVEGGWGDWSQWSSCEKPCGGSVVNRTRLCNNPSPSNGGTLCQGVNVDTKLECLSKCPGKFLFEFLRSVWICIPWCNRLNVISAMISQF